jgi:hypothetical protein
MNSEALIFCEEFDLSPAGQFGFVLSQVPEAGPRAPASGWIEFLKGKCNINRGSFVAALLKDDSAVGSGACAGLRIAVE